MSEWQPIKTAPRDGTPILIYRKIAHGIWGHIRMVKWTVGSYWGSPGGFAEQDENIAGWMPLPELPE